MKKAEKNNLPGRGFWRLEENDHVRRANLLILLLLIFIRVSFPVFMFVQVLDYMKIPGLIKKKYEEISRETALSVSQAMDNLDVTGIDPRLEEINRIINDMFGMTFSIQTAEQDDPAIKNALPSLRAKKRLMNNVSNNKKKVMSWLKKKFPDESSGNLEKQLEDIFKNLEVLHEREKKGEAAEELKGFIGPEFIQSLESPIFKNIEISKSDKKKHIGGFWSNLNKDRRFKAVIALDRNGECLNCHYPDKSKIAYLSFTKNVSPEMSKMEKHVIALILFVIIVYILIEGGAFHFRKRMIGLIKQLSDQNVELERSEKELGKYADEMESLAEERSKQLVHADRMVNIGILSAGVAHEINNPTAYISSNVQILKILWDRHIRKVLESSEEAKKDEKMPYVLDEVPDMLEAMKDGTKRIAAIVSNLKDFSRDTKTTFGTAKISDCIENAVKFCRLDTTLKNKVKIELNISNKIPDIVLSKQEIEQVLINIFTNAVHAMEGMVGGKKPSLTVSADYVKDEVVVKIADNGKGMDEETKDNIFNPFFTTKDVGKGTGLGLSICHGIVEKHRGTIEVESNPGEGTAFTIKLPLDPQKIERRRKSKKLNGGMRNGDK